MTGNTVNPSAVVIDATVASGPGRGIGVTVREDEAMIEGLHFRSYQNNIVAAPGGLLTVRGDCIFTTPTGQAIPISAGNGGVMRLWGNNTYIGSGSCASLAAGILDSTVLFGAQDQAVTIPVSFNFQGTCDFIVGTLDAATNAIVICPSAWTTWLNGAIVTGPRFFVGSGGGIGFTGSVDFIPGSLPGYINAATYGWYT